MLHDQIYASNKTFEFLLQRTLLFGALVVFGSFFNNFHKQPSTCCSFYTANNPIPYNIVTSIVLSFANFNSHFHNNILISKFTICHRSFRKISHCIKRNNQYPKFFSCFTVTSCVQPRMSRGEVISMTMRMIFYMVGIMTLRKRMTVQEPSLGWWNSSREVTYNLCQCHH
jgi:hypothetical protein